MSKPRITLNKARRKAIVRIGDDAPMKFDVPANQWRAAEEAAAGGAIPGFNPDTNSDGQVNVTDLLAVISGWQSHGYTVVHVLAVIAAWGPVEGVMPQQPFNGEWTLGNGDTRISDRYIKNLIGYAINAGNATRVGTLELINIKSDSGNYGAYLGSCDKLIARKWHAFTHRLGDNYGLRGVVKHIDLADCVLDTDDDDDGVGDNKATLRLSGTTGGQSVRDRFVGGKIMLGIGPGSSNDGGSFEGVTFMDGWMDVDSLELGPGCKGTTFLRQDFTGTPHCTPWDGSEGNKFIGCRKNGAPLTSAFFRNNAVGITITP